MIFALLQTHTHWHDPAANQALFDGLMNDARGDVDVFVLPEMFASGFTMAPQEVAEPMNGPTHRWMQQQAAARDAVVCGSLSMAVQDRFVNRFLWVQPDGTTTHYDKRHCFRMAGEHEHYASGEEQVCIEHADFSIMPAVCYDLRFPVWLRAAARSDLLLLVANWPARRAAAWRALLQARAIENQCYVIGVNILGTDGAGVDYAGDTSVFDPLGKPVLTAGSAPGVYRVAIDTARVRAVRESFPVWQDADSFELDG